MDTAQLRVSSEDAGADGQDDEVEADDESHHEDGQDLRYEDVQAEGVTNLHGLARESVG